MNSFLGRFGVIYRQTLLGALGGLCGSILHNKFLLDAFDADPNSLMLNVALGGIIGACIGAIPSLGEGVRHYSLVQTIQRGMVSALCCGICGSIAAPLSAMLHSQMDGGIFGRAVSLGLFGAGIGAAEGINGGGRFWRGVTGGVIGGIVAATLVEYLMRTPQSGVQEVSPFVAVLVVVVIGASIVFTLMLFVNSLASAWLEGLEGSKVAGQIYQLEKYTAPSEGFIGSDKKAAMVVWIPNAEDKHATLSITPEGTLLKHVAEESQTLVHGNPVSSCILKDGDVIEIVGSRLRYRQFDNSRFLFGS